MTSSDYDQVGKILALDFMEIVCSESGRLLCNSIHLCECHCERTVTIYTIVRIQLVARIDLWWRNSSRDRKNSLIPICYANEPLGKLQYRQHFSEIADVTATGAWCR